MKCYKTWSCHFSTDCCTMYMCEDRNSSPLRFYHWMDLLQNMNSLRWEFVVLGSSDVYLWHLELELKYSWDNSSSSRVSLGADKDQEVSCPRGRLPVETILSAALGIFTHLMCIIAHGKCTTVWHRVVYPPMETRSWPPLGLGVIGHAWGNFLAGNSPQTGVFFFSTGKEGEKLILFKKV